MRDVRAAVQAKGGLIDGLLAELFPRERQDYVSEAFWHHMGTGGKRIRPALCILTCEALGGEAEAAVPFATAVEVLHNMFLLHDDVEDGDTVRRDAPTVWVKYGVANAINVGDYMLGRAYTAILRSPVDAERRVRLTAAFTATYERTCLGQALDINARGAEGWGVEDYLRMVELKTGHYLALGMVGGAIVAGAGEETVRRLQELGSNMGPAFQIRDDLIDLTHGKGRGGVLGNDIREGKPSILYAHALEEAGAEDGARLREVMRRDRGATSEEDVRWVMELYERCGSLAFAQAKAESLVGEAHGTIERLPVGDKGFFRDVASFMASRAT
jgi:geranylgeranyl pyrophosphate synthase